MAEKLTNEQIIDTLKQMSALELSNLVKAVEEEFGVTAAAPVAAAAPAEEEESAKKGPSVNADDFERALALVPEENRVQD